MRDLYHATSALHRIVVWQMLLAIIAMRLMGPVKMDPLLLAGLGIIKLGLVGHFIFGVVVQLHRQSRSSSLLTTLLRKAPLLAGSSTELSMAILLLRTNRTVAAEQLFIGSVYAKVLVIGALCLISHGLYLPRPSSGAEMPILSDIIRLLIVGGMLIIASAPRVQGTLTSCDQGSAD